MPNLLLISTSRSRTKYFNLIKNHSNLNVTVISNPISFNLKNYFKAKKEINFEKIFQEKFREIDLKYDNKIYQKSYKLYIKMISPFIAGSYYKLFTQHTPHLMGLWNGKKIPEMIASEVAQHFDVQCFYFENGLFPNSTVVDKKGVNASNSLPRDCTFYQNYQITHLPKELNQRKALGKRIEENIDLPENYIFVPFQTNFDTQVVYHGRWIKNMELLFNLIYQLSEKLKINFILKEHPSERQMDYTHLHEKAKNNPYLNFANAINTQELIEKSTAIITINSSVGLEALLFNKRVIVLGEAFYDIEGITKSATNQVELTNILEQLHEWKVHEENTKKFLSYIINDYLVEGDWKNPNQVHFESLENHLLSFIEK